MDTVHALEALRSFPNEVDVTMVTAFSVTKTIVSIVNPCS